MNKTINLFDVFEVKLCVYFFALIARGITVEFSSGIKMLTYHNMS